MKKLLLYFGLAASVLTACDPNQDFIDALENEAKPAGINMPEALTLEAGDYKIVDRNGLFATQDEAAQLIPQILTDKYAANASNQGFLMVVNYKVDGSGYLGDLYTESQAYTLAAEDYTEMGFKYPNFSNTADRDQYIPVFLKDKFKYTQEAGMEKVISYVLRGTISMYHEYKFDGAAWVKTEKTTGGFDVDNAYELTSDDYNSMGENSGQPGKYDNFDSKMDIETYLKNFLAGKYPEAQADEVQTIKFKFYGNNDDKVVYAFDGVNWTNKGSLYYDWAKGDYMLTGIVLDAADKFVFDSKDGWAVIKITTYTLTDEDYALTGDDKYKNFGYYDDVAGTYNEVEVANIIDAKIAHILSQHYADAAEGTLFEVTFNFYSNGATNPTKRRFKKEGDTFVRVVEE